MRFSRKKFENAYDKCWVSVPKSDRTFKNGMDNPGIKDDILNLYRYKCTGKCTRQFYNWLKVVRECDVGGDLENVLFGGLSFYYCYNSLFEWWNKGERVYWFDPGEEGTRQQILNGCRPLFELFEEIKR